MFLLFEALANFTSSSATVTYDFLAIEDTNNDNVMDVLFVLKNTEIGQNKTCTAGMTGHSVLIPFIPYSGGLIFIS